MEILVGDEPVDPRAVHVGAIFKSYSSFFFFSKFFPFWKLYRFPGERPVRARLIESRP
jgi:hypothetical protein